MIYGRKKVLLLSNVGTLVGWIIFFIAFFLPVANIFSINSAIIGTFVITLPIVVLFFAGSLDGITGGNISVANAYLADVSSDKNRSKNFGKMAISSNLGFIVGPALAGVLGGTIYKEILPVLAAVYYLFDCISCNRFHFKRIKIKASCSDTTDSRKREYQKSFFTRMQRMLQDCQILQNLNSKMSSN